MVQNCESRLLLCSLAFTFAFFAATCEGDHPSEGIQSTPNEASNPEPADTTQSDSTIVVSDEDAHAFAKQIVEILSSANPEGESQADIVDWDGVAKRALAGLGMSDTHIAGFARGLKKSGQSDRGLTRRIQDFVSNDGGCKFTRILRDNDGTRIRVRLSSASQGIDFLDILLQKMNGNVTAIDIRQATTGEDFSQTLRRIYLLTNVKGNRKLFDRLLGKEADSLLPMDKLAELNAANGTNDYPKVFRIIDSLPEAIKDEKFVLLTEFNTAHRANDANRLARSIERFRKHHPTDPAVDILSIDYFAVRGEWDKAIQCLERLNQSLEGDAEVLAIMAGLLFNEKQYEKARQSIDEAIRLEPDRIDSYWSKVSITSAQKDFVSTSDTLKSLATEFGVSLNLDVYQENELMKPFMDSPEGAELVEFLETHSKPKNE